MSKTSLICSDITLDENTACVMLFQYKNHARIGLERFITGDHTFYVMDFVPEGGVGLDFDSIKENEILNGVVRINQTDIDENWTKKSFFSHFHLNEGYVKNYQTEKCSTEQANYLMTLARASRDNPPQFQVGGNYRKNSEGHNCITWAETHLKAAGIKMRPTIFNQSKSSYSDSFVAKPEKHIDNTNISYYESCIIL